MPLTILVVEDHAQVRHVICAALRRRADVQTFEAADGLEAVRKAEQLQPDLIMLDINLPTLHGFEVAERVRPLCPRSRVLFVSQESSSDIVQHAFSLGAQGYIHKQRAGTDLMPAIDAVLEGHRFVSSSVAFTEPAAAPVPRRHEILFCADSAAIVDGLSRFVADALNAADGAIVLATASHRKRLLQMLRAQGVDIDRAIEHGTYLSLDANEPVDRDRFLEFVGVVREAAARAGNAHPRVAVCGERAGRLWAAGRIAEAVQLEQFCAELAPDVDILCTYPVPHTRDDEALARICEGHTAVSAIELLDLGK